MGATTATFWFSWYLWLFIEFTILSICSAGVSIAMNVFKYSDNGLIFLWFWLFSINIAVLVHYFQLFLIIDQMIY